MKSKLGWQFQSVTGWADAVVNSDWVKIIDPPEEPRFQNRKTIGRVYLPDAETNNMIWNGANGARAWWARVAPVMERRRWVYAWELPNEPQPVVILEFCNALAVFTTEAAGLMRAAGFRSVGGNLAEGNPGGDTDTERANLFCAIAKGLTHCDYWSQHAYWVPDGYPHPEAGYNEWHALRYRMNRRYALERHIILPPVLLTEGGWDFGIVGKPKQGWRSYAPWDVYLSDLRRFDADLMADPGVAGCQLFVSGGYSDWQSFEIAEPESRELAAYITSTGGVEPPPPPPPPPPPSTVIIGRPLPAGYGVISQVFGANVDLYQTYGFAGHEGLDYAAPIGTPVLACTAGRVLFAGTSTEAAAYGVHVVVDHGKFRSWYCHMLAVDVGVGDIVTRGQRLGSVGNTGRSTGSHLHFGLQVEGARNGSKGFVDPWGLRILLGDA